MNERYLDLYNQVQKEHQNVHTQEKNSRVLIVDGTNTFIRCWGVIPTMNEDGEHVGGVTGTLKSIGYAIKKVKPTRVVVVFDGKDGSNQRKKIFSGYKQGREKNKLRVNRQYQDLMTDEDEKEARKRQYVWLAWFLKDLPVTMMIYDGVEADDVMAYVGTQLLSEDEQAVYMSTDKDFLQLINDKDTVWSPTKKIHYTKEILEEEYFGLKASNMLVYRVLDGDTSDKIPGVKGVGLKTFVKRFPEVTEDNKITVESLVELAKERSKESKIKIYKVIAEATEQIMMNKRLMQLKDPEFSGVIKMKIQNQFEETIPSLKKVDFLKVCMKYKVTNAFGNDALNWLNTTFGTLVTD
jgi:DNA polymerase-1